MRGAIVAMTADGIIGVAGKLPWHHSADLKRFKRRTLGATVIMGRRTWLSIGGRPLPGRRNVVISRSDVRGADCYRSIAVALASCTGDVWFIGGAQLYGEAIDYCDLIDVTWVPDRVAAADATRFPEIDWTQWQAGERVPLADDPRLCYQIFRRRIGRGQESAAETVSG